MTLPVIDTVAADAYFAGTVREAAWVAVTDPDAQLTEANAWLAALCWDETKNCCGNDFTDAYTRAASELALALSGNPTALIGAGSSSTAIKRAQLGGLSVEYFEAAAGAKSVSPKAPAVIRAFPWLLDVLGCFLKTPTGDSRIIARVRS
jgi:hypothetical protein